jgi:hypothetical protein
LDQLGIVDDPSLLEMTTKEEEKFAAMGGVSKK